MFEFDEGFPRELAIACEQYVLLISPDPICKKIATLLGTRKIMVYDGSEQLKCEEDEAKSKIYGKHEDNRILIHIDRFTEANQQGIKSMLGLWLTITILHELGHQIEEMYVTGYVPDTYKLRTSFNRSLESTDLEELEKLKVLKQMQFTDQLSGDHVVNYIEETLRQLQGKATETISVAFEVYSLLLFLSLYNKEVKNTQYFLFVSDKTNALLDSLSK